MKRLMLACLVTSLGCGQIAEQSWEKIWVDKEGYTHQEGYDSFNGQRWNYTLPVKGQVVTRNVRRSY
jgi:hypothetical protein